MRKSIRERFEKLVERVSRQEGDITNLEMKLRDKSREITKFVNNKIEFQLDHLGALKNRLRAACDERLKENEKQFESIHEAFQNIHNTIDFVIKSPPRFKMLQEFDNFIIKDISAVVREDNAIEYQYFIEDVRGLEDHLNGFLNEHQMINLANRKEKFDVQQFNTMEELNEAIGPEMVKKIEEIINHKNK